MDTEFEIIKKSSHAGKISNLYNRIAWIYDLFTDFEPEHHQKAIEIAGIKGNDSVLEVACGTGRATVKIARHIGKEGVLYAIDLAEAMLAKAKKRLIKNDMLHRVQLQLADAKKLPFADNKFDIVFNAFMFDLMDISDMPGVISEFKRILKPGGKLVLVNMSKDRKSRTLYEFMYEKGLLGFASGGCRPVYMKPFLEKAGFEKIERIYRKNKSWFFLNWLSGTEIVLGYKPL